MSLAKSYRRLNAFTLVELLVVIAIIGLLAALLLPAVSNSQLRAKRIWCENNLLQTGIAFQSYSHDHNSRFPMQVPISDGGALEFVQNGYLVNGQFFFAFRIFQVLSNELVTPKLLICPADTRSAAERFSGLQNSNVSYFIGVAADYFKPASMLAGDRNLATNTYSNPSILYDENGANLRWTRELHGFKGNVLFADGHVEEWNDRALRSSTSTPDQVNNLFMPVINLFARNPEPTSPTYAAAGQPGTTQNHSTAQSNNSGSQPQPSTASRSTVHPPDSFPVTPVGTHQKMAPIVSASAGVSFSNAVAASDLAATNLVANESVTTNEDDSGMSPANQKAAVYIKWTFGWFFLLLLLLLLINLWLQSRKKRRK